MSFWHRPKTPERRVKPYMPSPDEYIETLDKRQNQDSFAVPRRRRRWKRYVGLGLVVVLIVVIGYGLYLGSILAKISSQPFNLTGLAADSGGRTNVLILGEGDPGHAGEGLTDTMMVVSYNAADKRVAEISVPRDLRVSIPGYGTGKINSANALGGSKLAEQTVSNTLGIPINYVVQTDFTGLRELVDAIGGIDVNVKDRLVDTEYPCDYDQYKVCGLDIEPGLQHMNGARALQYVRCRKGTCGNDFGRAARQQEVIALVRQKLVRWQVIANPKQLIAITSALRDSLKTDMGSVQMLELALDWQGAQKHQPIQLVFSTATGGYLVSAGGSSDLLPADGTFAAIRNRVANIFTLPTSSSDLPQ